MTAPTESETHFVDTGQPLSKIDLERLTLQDLADTLLGDKIASGSERHVYPCHNSLFKVPCVAKICTGSQVHQNIIENEIWSRIQYTDHAKWFAPVLAIGNQGRVLIMQRTTLKLPECYPKKIPNFFTDMKYNNYGWIGKQFVCHDYGLTLLMEKGMSKRMRKADWWSDEI